MRKRCESENLKTLFSMNKSFYGKCFFNLLIKFCWCWFCRWWWWWWWIAALCATKIIWICWIIELNKLSLPTGPSLTLSCMVGFWHIPTFIITDTFPPWWDFVMVGICWVTKNYDDKWWWKIIKSRKVTGTVQWFWPINWKALDFGRLLLWTWI